MDVVIEKCCAEEYNFKFPEFNKKSIFRRREEVAAAERGKFGDGEGERSEEIV
jgi:hypothetical protein